MFAHVEPFAGDPILALVEVFNADPRPHKVNLSIGIYFDEQGRIPVLPSVKLAEARVVASGDAKPYLPIEGAANYRKAVQQLLFGADHEALRAGRVATIQSVGSSGGLKVGADFIKRWFAQSEVWVSDPTWDNHRSMFEGAGLEVHTYPYYDAQGGGVRFAQMMEALQRVPERSIVLLHACCHNPTGYDITPAQWDQVIAVVKERNLTAFLDMAYQGFGYGIAEDGAVIAKFVAAGLNIFVSTSFSKSFSLYGERVGALSVVGSTKEETDRVLSQLKIAIRTNYSNPPTHGGAIVAAVLGNPELRALWEKELGEMRVRIKAMRQKLVDGLKAAGVTKDMSFITTQIGMFSYSGLSKDQMVRLRTEFGVYGTDTGRMCVAALNSKNIDYVCQAIAKVI